MAEINCNDKKIKTIAYYLPQFHEISENNMAYGKGFMEWTNTKKAIPLYEGHYQPRTPYRENYYNLLDKGVLEKQSEIAQSYGVWGFCYYHYWFKGGKKLLEKPIELMIENKNVTIPFCLSWANENWTKKWDGGNSEIIVEQNYGEINDWEEHLQYLLQFFRDPRYITIDGKLLFVIYKPEIIPDLTKMLNYFRKRIIEFGFKGIIFASQYPAFYLQGHNRKNFDYFIEFEPAFVRDTIKSRQYNKFNQKIKQILYNLHMDMVVETMKNLKNKKCLSEEKKLDIRDFEKDWDEIIKIKDKEKSFIYGAFTDWDNTPRNKNGISYVGSTPDKFYSYMLEQKEKVLMSNSLNVIFINAWNEWAEGAYLEPDQKYGYQYLEALKKVIEN